MIRTIIDLIGFFNSLSGFLVAVVFLEYTYHYLCQKYKKSMLAFCIGCSVLWEVYRFYLFLTYSG